MRQASKPVIYIMVANAIFMVSGYAVHFFLGRHLGPAGYGVYGVVIGLMSLVNLVLTSGLPNALSKYTAENPAEGPLIKAKALKMQVAFSFILTAVYLLSATPIAKLLNDYSLEKYIRLSALVFPSYSLYALFSGYYNGLHKFRSQALLLAAYSVAKVFLIVSMVVAIGLPGAIIGFAFAPLASLLLIMPLEKGEGKDDGVHRRKEFDSRKLIRFALPVIIISVISTLVITADLIMVKALLRDDRLAGLYTAASTLAKIPNGIFSALSIVIFPIVARVNKEKEKGKLRKVIRGSLSITIFPVFAVAAAISISSPTLIRTFYSPFYLDATIPLVILSFGLAAFTLFEVLATILNGLGKPEIPMYIVLSVLPLTLLFNYIFIPRYMLIGAAMATTLSSFLMVASSLFLVLRNYREAGVVRSNAIEEKHSRL